MESTSGDFVMKMKFLSCHREDGVFACSDTGRLATAGYARLISHYHRVFACTFSRARQAGTGGIQG